MIVTVRGILCNRYLVGRRLALNLRDVVVYEAKMEAEALAPELLYSNSIVLVLALKWNGIHGTI